MGGPSESSSSSQEDKRSSAILARLDRIALILQNLLDVSIELSQRLREAEGRVRQRGKGVEERPSAEYLPQGADVSMLLDLPDHLRKPLMTIFKLGGRGTAAQVSEKLGISRPQASATLNSLVRLNLLLKKREGKEGRRGADAIFMIPEEKP